MASQPSVFTASGRQRSEVERHDEGVEGVSEYTAACVLLSFSRLRSLFSMLSA